MRSGPPAERTRSSGPPGEVNHTSARALANRGPPRAGPAPRRNHGVSVRLRRCSSPASEAVPGRWWGAACGAGVSCRPARSPARSALVARRSESDERGRASFGPAAPGPDRALPSPRPVRRTGLAENGRPGGADQVIGQAVPQHQRRLVTRSAHDSVQNEEERPESRPWNQPPEDGAQEYDPASFIESITVRRPRERGSRAAASRAGPTLVGSARTLRISAPGAIRTRDTRFRRAVLYPLSYEGMGSTLPHAAPDRGHRRRAADHRAPLRRASRACPGCEPRGPRRPPWSGWAPP